MISSVNNILNEFEPINLDEMDNVKLLNRVDNKFIFTSDKLSAFLDYLKPYYKVLTIENKRTFDYESLYFDTDDFLFYQLHHRGKLNRYKVRYRKYRDTETCYLEVKFKSNIGRTNKTRKKKKSIKDELSEKSKKFLREAVPIVPPEELKSKLWIYYTRITLVHKILHERLTLDINLNYKAHNSCLNEKTDSIESKIALQPLLVRNEVNLPFLIIAEIKQEKFTFESPFIQLMLKKRIFPISFSKYCIGCVLLFPHLKYNRFKPKLLTLNKMSYGNTRGFTPVWNQAC